MRKQRVQYRESTEGSPKWAANHNAGCCLYAPDDVCICSEIEAEDAEERAMAEQAMAEEAISQKADTQIVGYGCLLCIALMLGAVAAAVAIWHSTGIMARSVLFRAEAEPAPYSVCERCGALLDGSHAECVEEGAYYAIRR